MKCEKCDGLIVNGCCTKCGMLSNNIKIDNKKNNIDKNEDLKLFNEDFNIINLNKNLFLVFLFGPMYFSYRGFLFIGTILGLIDYFFFYKFVNLEVLTILLMGNNVLLYFFINRLFYVIFSNYICLLIDKVKVKIIKKRYKENYKKILSKYKHHKYYLLVNILIYVLLIAIFVISKRIKNGLL